MLSIVRSRALTALRSVFSDPLYRGSLIMLGNSASLAIFGFVFWLVGTHIYSASAIGAYASITAGTGLLAAVTLLGLPNTITRRIATATNARQLMRVAMTVTAVIGGLLCLATVLLIGPHLPAQLSLGQRGPAALLAHRDRHRHGHQHDPRRGPGRHPRDPGAGDKEPHRQHHQDRSSWSCWPGWARVGLLLAYGLGISLSSILSGLALWRRLDRGGERISPMRLLKSHMSMTAGNYASMIMGILPSTVVPIEVLVILGAAATGRFAVAFTLAGLPQRHSLHHRAGAVRRNLPSGRHARRPATQGVARDVRAAAAAPGGVLMVGAPLVLRLFGAAYASTATACLRVLLLSAVCSPAGPTWSTRS